MQVCNRCGSPVVRSGNPEYSYLCLECDEDLYEFETHKVNASCDSCEFSKTNKCPWEGTYHHMGEHGEKIGICNGWKPKM